MLHSPLCGLMVTSVLDLEGPGREGGGVGLWTLSEGESLSLWQNSKNQADGICSLPSWSLIIDKFDLVVLTYMRTRRFVIAVTGSGSASCHALQRRL